jgi:uncharacterized protein with GYD domain
MPKYLFSARYTMEGVKGVIKDGGSKRRDAADQALKSVGGRLESFYFAFGEDDALGVVELPDQASAVALSATINASGTVMIKLTPLVTVEEVDRGVKMNTQYRPPGK